MTCDLAVDDLVALARTDDRSAFAELMRRFNRRLYRVVMCVLHDASEVEDTIQQAYVLAFSRLHQFAGKASFGTWLTRIALHEAFACRERRGRRRAVSEEGSSPTALDPERITAAREIGAAIQLALANLPEPSRLVFVLRTLEGLPFADIAGSLDVSEEAAKVRFHRARAQLGADLERRLGASREELLSIGGARCDRLVAGTLARLAPRGDGEERCGRYSSR